MLLHLFILNSELLPVPVILFDNRYYLQMALKKDPEHNSLECTLK